MRMRTTSVLPRVGSGRHSSRGLPLAVLPQLPDQAGEPFGPDQHLECVLLDVDPLDEEVGASSEELIMHRSGRTYGL